MSSYRDRLPQLRGSLFLTDGGLETTLIFHEGLSLPYFAAFSLLSTREGTQVLRRYFERYARIAREQEVGLVLETPTWRANPDWAAKLGYDSQALAGVQQRSVELLLDIREGFETGRTKIVISGNLGPRGDGYSPSNRMSPVEAQAYRAPQIEEFAQTEASERSHAELDESTDLDAGNPEELARQYRKLQGQFRRLSVVGGCCGTDHRHVEAIGRTLTAVSSEK
jgi:homocysteine S-methyltransferase